MGIKFNNSFEESNNNHIQCSGQFNDKEVIKFDSPDSMDSGIVIDNSDSVEAILQNTEEYVQDISKFCLIDDQNSAQDKVNIKVQSMDINLPLGWEAHQDAEGDYYWHKLSGTIQREPPKNELIIEDNHSYKSFVSLPMSTNVDLNPFRSTYHKTNAHSRSCIKSNTLNVRDGPAVKRSMTNSVSNRDFTSIQKQQLTNNSKSCAPKNCISQKNQFGNHVKQHQNSSEIFENSKDDNQLIFNVKSLGWCEIGESDLTPERSSKAVNKCIMKLSYGKNSIETIGKWGEGQNLILIIDSHTLRLKNGAGKLITTQPIHTIKVWGVGKENGRDFAYVVRDTLNNNNIDNSNEEHDKHYNSLENNDMYNNNQSKTMREKSNSLNPSKRYVCYVFRCDTNTHTYNGYTIANTLKAACKRLMIERSAFNLQHFNINLNFALYNDPYRNNENDFTTSNNSRLNKSLSFCHFPTHTKPNRQTKSVNLDDFNKLITNGIDQHECGSFDRAKAIGENSCVTSNHDKTIDGLYHENDEVDRLQYAASLANLINYQQRQNSNTDCENSSATGTTHDVFTDATVPHNSNTASCMRRSKQARPCNLSLLLANQLRKSTSTFNTNSLNHFDPNNNNKVPFINSDGRQNYSNNNYANNSNNGGSSSNYCNGDNAYYPTVISPIDVAFLNPMHCFPTPIEEPYRIIKALYLGEIKVEKPSGLNVLNEAIDLLYERVPQSAWTRVRVKISPSCITIHQQDALLDSEPITRCRVRYLSFLGISRRDVRNCGFIMSGISAGTPTRDPTLPKDNVGNGSHNNMSTDFDEDDDDVNRPFMTHEEYVRFKSQCHAPLVTEKFLCQVLRCEPSSAALCKTIEAACRLRYQKCLDSARNRNTTHTPLATGDMNFSSKDGANYNATPNAKKNLTTALKSMWTSITWKHPSFTP